MKFAAIVAALVPARAAGLLVVGGNSAGQDRAEQWDAIPLDGCGPVMKCPHAKPKEYKDSRKTFFNATSKKTEDVSFESGKNVTFECRPGYTTDGSKDGSKEFDVECTEHGYFKTHGVCMKASKCGAVPNISHAVPTGKGKGTKVEFGCVQGYSLDGKKVVNDGLGANRFFEVECIEFSGEYEPFEGNCTAYAFTSAKETIRIYNQVTEALFVVSCKGTLKKAFGKGKAPGMSKVCDTFKDSKSDCSALVSKIKGDFTKELKAREDHDKGAKKDWTEEPDADRPGIDDEADEFCTELWALLEMPSL